MRLFVVIMLRQSTVRINENNITQIVCQYFETTKVIFSDWEEAVTKCEIKEIEKNKFIWREIYVLSCCSIEKISL